METNKTLSPQGNAIRNFSLTLSGLVLMFCVACPNFADAVISFIRMTLSYVGMGWAASLLIASKIILFLGGMGALAAGVALDIIEKSKEKKQPNWVAVGCAGGGVLFTILSLIPVMFWMGIFAIPAFVVAMVFYYKDVYNVWQNPTSKIASYILIGTLIVYWDRLYNVMIGMSEINLIGGLVAIAAAIYLCVWMPKFFSAFDAPTAGAFRLIFIGTILYASATLLNMIPLINIVGFLVAIGAWVLYLIGYIKLMQSKAFGQWGSKIGLILLIAHCVGILSFIPLFNLASLVGIGLGWLLIIKALEEKK